MSAIRTVTTHFLELSSPEIFRPAGRAGGLGPAESDAPGLDLPGLALLTPTEPGRARQLYVDVGGPWCWVDRLSWPLEAWADHLRTPGVEIRVASHQGRDVGYFELIHESAQTPIRTAHGEVDEARMDERGVEIRYLGLIPQALGRGWGRWLLDRAVRRAWDLGRPGSAAPPSAAPGAQPPGAGPRVWLSTCTLDAPAALPNYLARGFMEFRRVTREVDLPC